MNRRLDFPEKKKPKNIPPNRTNSRFDLKRKINMLLIRESTLGISNLPSTHPIVHFRNFVIEFCFTFMMKTSPASFSR